MPAAIRLEGLVAPLRTLTAADLAALPHRKQTTTDKEGKKHVYRGVALADVLAQASVPAGKALLTTATDCHQAVFAQPEIDADFSPKTIRLADCRNGQPLFTHDGPCQLIVPLEKKLAGYANSWACAW
ncbi:MAG: hypothetical protein EOO62_06120 [Hymenobacter sp.]|nr:MAG: hypothetical protein EOO62_06120 [Hymenobacter sp.]